MITDSVNKPSPSSSPSTIKFLYSYGGKIRPRQTDGKLRYVGGHTRVLSVNRSISYTDLIAKFNKSCQFSVTLKCKLPTEDLDVLISVTSDADLATVVAEYDRVSPDSKIRSVIFPLKSISRVSSDDSLVSSVKTISTVPSSDSLVDYSSAKPPLCPVLCKAAVRKVRPLISCRENAPLPLRFRQYTVPKNYYFVKW